MWFHFGKSNARRKYLVNGRTLNNIDVSKDLGVQIHSSLKIATPENRVAFEYKTQEMTLELYRTLVILHLEYCLV